MFRLFRFGVQSFSFYVPGSLELRVGSGFSSEDFSRDFISRLPLVGPDRFRRSVAIFCSEMSSELGNYFEFPSMDSDMGDVPHGLLASFRSMDEREFLSMV